MPSARRPRCAVFRVIRSLAILGQASARVSLPRLHSFESVLLLLARERTVRETRGGSSQLNIPLATIGTIPATWSPSGSQRPNSVLRYWSSRNQHMEKFGRAGESTDLRSSFRIRSGMHLGAPILRLNMATLQQDHGNRRGTGRQVSRPVTWPTASCSVFLFGERDPSTALLHTPIQTPFPSAVV